MCTENGKKKWNFFSPFSPNHYPPAHTKIISFLFVYLQKAKRNFFLLLLFTWMHILYTNHIIRPAHKQDRKKKEEAEEKKTLYYYFLSNNAFFSFDYRFHVKYTHFFGWFHNMFIMFVRPLCCCYDFFCCCSRCAIYIVSPFIFFAVRLSGTQTHTLAIHITIYLSLHFIILCFLLVTTYL